MKLESEKAHLKISLDDVKEYIMLERRDGVVRKTVQGKNQGCRKNKEMGDKRTR